MLPYTSALINVKKETLKLLYIKIETNIFLLYKKQLKCFLMMNLLQQIKHRRLALKLKQNEMPMRIGISRQQYQRLEAKGNPRLDTLELIAKGLNSDVMLIPKEKLNAVLAILESDGNNTSLPHKQPNPSDEKKAFYDDPWKGLLEDKDGDGDGDEDDNGN
tara:strand:- start:587 stop:1069 length:483 start_codon:yes stop_codon:yes gene_type:complete